MSFRRQSVTLILATLVAQVLSLDQNFLHGAGGRLTNRAVQGGKHLLRGPDLHIIDPSKVRQLSWKPRAFLYSGFLSSEECDHLVNLARPGVRPSAVVDSSTGKSMQSNVRTSAGTFLQKYQDPVVKRIEDRISAWTFLPRENGEAIQVLRYNLGQKYDAHFDYFHDPTNIQLGGHRLATVLMYLSDVEEGGETVFPSSEAKPHAAAGNEWSDCAKRGVAVKPRKGDALLFFSLHPDATTDPSSLHAGCPVIHGEKWSATKWIHVQSFDSPVADPGKCEDLNEQCGEWAAAGECKRNVAYMVGEGTFTGNCRKACNAC